MSELWINFLQKEAAARETGGGNETPGPMSPSGGGGGVLSGPSSAYGGSAPTTPSGKR